MILTIIGLFGMIFCGCALFSTEHNIWNLGFGLSCFLVVLGGIIN